MKTLLLFLSLAALAATAHAATIELTFSDNSTNESAFTVERSDDDATFAEIAILPPSEGTGQVGYTDDGLEAGREYAYRVRAVNEYGYSGYTNIALGTARGSPAAPGDALTAEPTPTLRITVREDGTIAIENL